MVPCGLGSGAWTTEPVILSYIFCNRILNESVNMKSLSLNFLQAAEKEAAQVKEEESKAEKRKQNKADKKAFKKADKKADKKAKNLEHREKNPLKRKVCSKFLSRNLARFSCCYERSNRK